MGGRVIGRIFCISAGQEQVKKRDSKVNRNNLYLNYGLLGLASQLKSAGFEPLVVHGHFETPKFVFDRCVALGMLQSELPILVSIPSFYALSWVQAFMGLIKSQDRESKIILGGRWVVGGPSEVVEDLFSEADVIVRGLGDRRIVSIVEENMRDTSSRNCTRPAYQFSERPLDYSLLLDRHRYQPAIEVSRGCGMGCSFCQEKDKPLQPLKDPHSLVREVESSLLSDELRPMTPYFEASMFVPKRRWLDGFIAARHEMKSTFRWRSEGRVDSVLPVHLPKLAQGGLAVLDLGLESASPEQLLRMKKTRDPKAYLSKASRLLRAARDCGIDVKVNILLYPGETGETLQQTISWLEEHRSAVRGVSVGPVIVFGLQQEVSGYVRELERFGARISHQANVGATHLHLSPEIDYAASIELSHDISASFMSPSDYFYLKSFSYFARDYTYSDFLRDRRADNQLVV